ncbi:MAG: helix-turn-helix transcriptional regulator [Aeromonas sp.]|uniref:helix-turn-helix transcriptional regulator n=1 Tax=Aeromonas sp. TaxID=647 RepID=UPI003F3A7D0E
MERDSLITVLMASLETLRTTIPANTEAVLHDLTRPEESVIAIVNGHVSGRKQGDALLAGPDDDMGFLGLLETTPDIKHRTFSGYVSRTASGKCLNSASTLYYGEGGVPLVAFCINVDTETVSQLKRDLDYLFLPAGMDEEPEGKSSNISIQTLDEVLQRYRQTGAESKIDFRRRVVSDIHGMGFFKIKGSVNHVARVLGVTRYTIYNYLEKCDEK